MIVAGIDYSLTCPCVCIYNDFNKKKVFKFEDCMFFFLTDIKKYADVFYNNIRGELFPKYDSSCQRYDSISDWAVDLVIGCDMVSIEDYAYNAKGRVFHIAENTGILKYKLYQKAIPIEVVQPTVVKKFATGKGNSDKNNMYKFFLMETAADIKGIITPGKDESTNPVSDVVDSYYICKHLYKSMIT